MDTQTIVLIISLVVNGVIFLTVLIMLLGGLRKIQGDQRKIRANMLSSMADYNQGDATVLLGDSITESYPISEMFPNEYVINRGISGDTTAGVLDRLVGNVIKVQPKKIFILIGTNDLGNELRSPKYILRNYEQILKLLSQNLSETKIYVELVLPTNPNMTTPGAKHSTKTRKNVHIKEINEGLKVLSEKFGCTLVDTVGPMSDANGNLIAAYTREGLHLTMKGYKALTDVLIPYIRE